MLKYGPYSPSRLDTATCGFAFYNQYVSPTGKKKNIENIAQARGSAVHEIFEKITQAMCQNPNAAFDEGTIRTWAKEAISRHPSAYVETGAILDMAKLYIRKPPPLLVADAEIELRLAVKREGDSFVACDYDDPQAMARGRADIMMISDDMKTAVVYDHKTQPNVEDADTFQLGFYAWVISKIHPYLDEIQTVLHFARYGSYSLPYVWTREDLAKIEDEILTRIQFIEDRAVWEATPHKNCQYCPFITSCPAMGEFIEQGDDGSVRVRADGYKILGDTNKAVKVAGLISILDEYSARATKELKEHVKGFGAIAIPGKVFDFKGTDYIHWDSVNSRLREKTYAIFEKHNVDPKKYMSFNQTASKTIWLEENELLVRELSELFPRKTETRFAGHKA